MEAFIIITSDGGILYPEGVGFTSEEKAKDYCNRKEWLRIWETEIDPPIVKKPLCGLWVC